jgi:ATP diphosphatase
MTSLSDNLQSLVDLMQRLRDPETGCPWDQQQSFQSIAPHTLAETYEVLDAIARENYTDLCEELGDLFFQILFYSQMATEQNSFHLNDVFEQLLKKMLRRHPHVFPDGTLASQRPPGPVQLPDWNALKQQEKSLDRQSLETQSSKTPLPKKPLSEVSETTLLASVKTSTPPLVQSIELQKRAAEVGFDWPDAASTLAKIEEETQELLQALAEQGEAQPQAIEEEFGDLFFSLMNTARKLQLDPELSLMKANLKFRKRFLGMEQAASDTGVTLNEMNLDELEALWKQAKQRA